MRLCVVSFKPCWQGADGAWRSDGGFPLQISALASLFDATTLLTVTVPERPGGIALSGSIRVAGLPSPRGTDLRRKLSVARLVPRYVSVFVRHFKKAEVVHTPLPGDLPLVGFLVALVMRRRMIARYGGSWATTARTTLFNRITRGLMRAVAGGRRVMLATGEGQEADGRVRFVFSTALSARELRRIDARTGRGLARPARLVYIGRLSEEKGVAFLLEAVARLGRQMGSAAPRLAIVGDGPLRRDLEGLVGRLDCADRVTFEGQKTREELSVELARADLCVQPSLTEGLSKAWLDAMAHGLPVVGTRVGSAAAVMGAPGERGWLVPPGDAEALVATLLAVLTQPIDWPEIRSRCRAYAEARTLEAWAARIEAICVEQWGVALGGARKIA